MDGQDRKAPEGPLTVLAGGVRIAVRVTPRASRTAAEGISAEPDGRMVLRVRLAAPPVEGAANKALVAFVAELARVRRSEVTIRSGEAGRLKIVEIEGEPRDLVARLAAAIG